MAALAPDLLPRRPVPQPGAGVRDQQPRFLHQLNGLGPIFSRLPGVEAEVLINALFEQAHRAPDPWATPAAAGAPGCLPLGLLQQAEQ